MSTTTEQTQALEKSSAKTPAVITTPGQYRDALSKWSAGYNILTPFSDVTGIAPSFGIIASVVKIDPDQTRGEVYSGTTPSGAKGMPFLKGTPGTPGEELALAKVGLRKIAENAGISTWTERTDPRTLPNYWEFRAFARYRGLDGTIITRSATFEWDLRDGSDRLKGWTANQITEGRKNGLRNCEARAINAAIRECGCGIKQKYTRAELERPFLVVRIAFQPDMNDPAVKQAVTMRALEGTAALYPTPAAAAIGSATGDEDAIAVPRGDDGPRQVGSGATTAAAGSAPASPAAPPKADPDLPPCEGAVRVVKVDEKPFTYKKGPKTGTQGLRYVIVDSNGVEHSTFSETHAKDARRFQVEHAWVEFNEESDGQYTNLLEIMKAQPSLLPDASEL